MLGWPLPHWTVQAHERQQRAYQRSMRENRWAPVATAGSEDWMRYRGPLFRNGTYVSDFMLFMAQACGVRTLLAPLENYRLHQQGRHSLFLRAPPLIPAQLLQDLRPWFKGNTMSLARFSCGVLSLRWLKDGITARFPGNKPELGHFIATGVAALLGLMALHPLDAVRTHVAVRYNHTYGRSQKDFVGETLLDFSLRDSWWHGLRASCVGLGVYMSTVAGVYYLYGWLLQDAQQFQFLHPSARHHKVRSHENFSALLACFLGYWAGYPFDTIRRNLMLYGGGDKSTFTAEFKFAREFFVRHRLKGLYAGAGAGLVQYSILGVLMFGLTLSVPETSIALEIPDEEVLQFDAKGRLRMPIADPLARRKEKQEFMARTGQVTTNPPVPVKMPT